MIMAAWFRATLLATACLGLLSGCTAKYRLHVQGDDPEAVRSLFLIAADEAEVGTVAKESAILALIHPDRQVSYHLFAQYEPQPGTPSRWREVSTPRNKLGDSLKVDLADDELDLELVLKKDILEDYSDLELVVIVHGRDRWLADKIMNLEISSNDGHRVLIRPGSLDRVIGE